MTMGNARIRLGGWEFSDRLSAEKDPVKSQVKEVFGPFPENQLLNPNMKNQVMNQISLFWIKKYLAQNRVGKANQLFKIPIQLN